MKIDPDSERHTGRKRRRPSIGNRVNNPPSLSDAEVRAVAILHADGWTVGELCMTFQAGERAVRNAINSTDAEVDA